MRECVLSSSECERSTQEAKQAVDVIYMTSKHPQTHAGMFRKTSNWLEIVGLLFYSFVSG